MPFSMTLQNTFRALIKIAGKILFVIGLVLNIYMIFFGFWPSLIYVLIMLAGAGMITVNKNIDVKSLFNTNTERARKIIPSIISSVQKVDAKSVQNTLKTAAITVLAVFVLAISILVLGQGYFKKRDTISDCKEIAAALEFYKENKRAYPPDLITLISNNPMRLNWNKDSWGNPYQYTAGNNGTSFTLTSSGKDGKFNTSDDIVFRN